MATDTRERARRVFAFRGSPTNINSGIPIEQAWKVERTAKGIRYRIDDAHHIVAAVLEGASTVQNELILSMLRVIEETVPIQKIWLDTAEQKETPLTSFATSSNEAVLKVMRSLFKDMLVRKCMSVKDAREKI
jgi:hypothetical protein